MPVTNIRADLIAAHTAEVMQRAVFSACELNNFPLRATDVQCAFDNWCADRNARLAGGPADRQKRIEQLHTLVREHLHALGFTF